MTHTFSAKPTFFTQLTALPPKLSGQIMGKLTSLCEDPSPDGHTKKKLKGMQGLYRLRSGDYRVFYTYDATHVSVLKLDKRDEDTFSDLEEPEHLGAGPGSMGYTPALEAEPGTQGEQTWQQWIQPTKSQDERPLPYKLTEELLGQLNVPEGYWPTLLPIETEDALLAEESIPEEIRLRVCEAVVDKGLDEVLRQPDFIAEPDDLLQFKPGELIPFLLRLNPEQKKFVAWGVGTQGPTLLKGAAGTGKSTVALYRARAMVRALSKTVERPRILFTTYTNALVNFSRPQLERLLAGLDCDIEVRTADSLTMELAKARLGKHLSFPNRYAVSGALNAAWTAKVVEGGFAGNKLSVKAKQKAAEKVGRDYILEEFHKVIQARGLDGLEAYLAAPRPGRRLALSKTAKTAVWELHEHFAKVLADQDLVTWEQLRWEAVRGYEAMGDAAPKYDGVIVDEVQDLDPSVIRLLASMVRHPGGLFLTADADQSIYGGSFRWKDIHESLAFTGRTAVLKANHRTTKEIGEAARTYLAEGALEDDKPDRTYVHQGPPPAVRAVKDRGAEADLVARFVKAATKEFHLPLGAAAVLVPTKDSGQKLALDLQREGVDATFMASDALDLDKPGVKVVPLVAAKGLEFPVVALAGFLGATFPYLKPDWTEEAQAEALAKARRIVYVGMTRAMRALLVVVPSPAPNTVLEGFDPTHWNTGADDSKRSAQ